MEKEVVVLVGPQGSGKTTLVKKDYSNYTYISQDEQGKKGHFELFLKSLKNKDSKIIVDRMNHLEGQRDKYLSLAKKKGYGTKIIVLNEDFKTCFNRIMNRCDHPTLSSSIGPKRILKALHLYFREYEIPMNSEADEVEFTTEYDPYMLDLSSKYSKFLLIGDVHGCYDEMIELLEKMNFVDDGTMALVFLGDLIDKGPKIDKVVDFFLETKNAYSIIGNHEHKCIRYLRGNPIQIVHGLDKTIKQMDLEKVKEKYDNDFLFELESLPYVIKLSKKDYVVHAGINPLRKIERQTKQHLLYVRNFNTRTFAFSNPKDPFWFEEYSKDLPNIYFGHHFHENINVKPNVFSMDGYCVYGNVLRGMEISGKNLEKKKNFQVKAKDDYYESMHTHPSSKQDFFEKELGQGYLKKSENEHLVLFNYTNSCVYEKHWNKITKASRGLIINKKTQDVVARPFEKFFNLNENEESQLKNLPRQLAYDVFEKIDGALGIIYFFNNKWNISTRGALVSKQSLFAEKMMKDYDLSLLNPAFTYMVEIIHPEIETIVSYGNKKKLILLGARETQKGEEMTYDSLREEGRKSGLEVVKRVSQSLTETISLCNTLDSNSEGFVLKFENDLRIKIKGKKYLDIARVLLNMDELSLWKSMKNGKVPTSLLEKIPEELLLEIENKVRDLEKNFKKIEKELDNDTELLSSCINKEKKEIALFIEKNKTKFNHSSIMMDVFSHKKEKIENYIMKQIKPFN